MDPVYILYTAFSFGKLLIYNRCCYLELFTLKKTPKKHLTQFDIYVSNNTIKYKIKNSLS